MENKEVTIEQLKALYKKDLRTAQGAHSWKDFNDWLIDCINLGTVIEKDGKYFAVEL